MTANENLDLPADWEDDGSPEPGRRKGRRAVLIALGLVLALVVGAGAVVGGYLLSFRGDYNKIVQETITRGPSDGDRPEAEAGTGRNILLLGSDRRSEEDAIAEGVVGERSDVVMLVHISDDNASAYVTSFPRDLYVDIPGYGKDRINAALAFGGLSLAVTTVENYTGVPIDHVALIDFDGISGLVDSLDGIDVDVPVTFTGDGYEFTEGRMHMDGDMALTFVRQRYQFADGDFQRNRNQQAVLGAIAEKLIARDTLTDPGKLRSAVSSIAPYLRTDDALTPTAMIDLGLSMRNVRGGDIYYLGAPHSGPFTTSGGASVVGTDEEAMELLREALRTDSMGTYYAENAGRY